MTKRRRDVLRIAGTVLAAGFAGCGGDSGGTATETTTEEMKTDTVEPVGGGDDETETATETETETATETETETATGTQVVIDNVGVSAWEVVEDESGAVAPTGEENPTMTLEAGTRYVIENRGWDVHPLAFRAADDSPLLSQSADGSYEDDGDVDWVDDGETLAFTVTEALAADLDYYICTVHASMRGSVESA